MKQMMRLALLFMMLLACVGASAQEAEDITLQCNIKACEWNIQLDRLTDRNYKTAWYTKGSQAHYLEVTAPQGQRIGGVYLQWKRDMDYELNPFQIELYDNGEWLAFHIDQDNAYLANYVALPGVDAVRITPAPERKQQLRLCELTVLGMGDTPGWVQQWQPTAQRAELMVVIAHPDDEVLYMGGAIPYYAGEMRKDTVVVYLTCNYFYRGLELLDCLWLCGVRTYPVFMGLPDRQASTLAKMYAEQWDQNNLYGEMTKLYRKYKPLVVVTHDRFGEYGHGAHKAAADAVRQAAALAADPAAYTASCEAYGTWDVPKIYLHLYEQNRITLDWNQPLAFFDGQTALDIAKAGFQRHVSQAGKAYLEVLDSGPYDNSLFGLYRSLVGPDEAKNDFFEHMELWADAQ